MKINENQHSVAPASTTRPVDTRVQPGAAGEASTRVDGPAARVELSGRSRELHEALKAANEAGDVRRGEVERVRDALREGRYEIDPRTIAERMLDRRI